MTRSHTIWSRTLFASLVGISVGTAVVLAPPLLHEGALAAPEAQAPGVPSLSYDPSISLAPLVEAYGPAVVNLEVAQKVQMPAGLEALPFFGPQGGERDEESGSRIQRGAGSGFIVSADGYILTNNHVVDDATEVIVRLGDKREFEARVIGTDPRTDVALVKVDTDEALPYVELGVSGDMRVGDWVVAIGNPFGLSNTVTAGIISAKGRIIGAGPYDDFIQTDASINPGNSGGPLFNLAGKVVGINTAINPYGQGIGFAVPIDQVSVILDDLKDDGHVARGWIGVGLQDLEPELKERLAADKGVVISQVYQGTPAADAGLEPGDVVYELNGTEVSDSNSLVRAVGSHKPGETVKLGLYRDGKHKQLAVKLGERPEETALRTQGWRQGPEDEAPGGISPGTWGFTARELPDQGVVVVEVADGSPADGRLRPGDVIVEANRQKVRSGKDLSGAMSDDGTAMLVVRRGEAQVLVTLKSKGE